MIRAFLDSWDLFGEVWLVGLLVAGLLALVGIVVVARNQIFVGAAVSQASTLGVALGMAVGTALQYDAEWLQSDGFLRILAIVFGVLAALLTSRGGPLVQSSNEASTGWVFLAGGSLAILVLSHSPRGTEEIHRLLSSSMLGASSSDLVVFSVLTVITAALLWRLRAAIVLTALDPPMAAAVGVPPWFRGALLMWLGLTVGLSIRVTGTLFTFGCLVLPTLAARNLCREVRQVIIVTPLLAVGTVLVAFIVANSSDDPPGPMGVAFLCGVAMVAWGIGRLRR